MENNKFKMSLTVRTGQNDMRNWIAFGHPWVPFIYALDRNY
jgi:hypothetical protein